MDKAQQLVDLKICASFGEARRLIMVYNGSDKIEQLIRNKTVWGRRHEKTSKLVWPKENHAMETV